MGKLYTQFVPDSGQTQPLLVSTLDDALSGEVLSASQQVAVQVAERHAREIASQAAAADISAAVEGAQAVEVDGSIVPECDA